jgi:Tfp pilus assembly protein PilX
MPVSNENGFVMVTMMGVMLIVLAIVFTTSSAADGDLRPARHDEDRKIAYAAAEAGIQNYLFHLVQDGDYWSTCTNVPAPNAVNQRWSGTGADTRTRWLNVPGSQARYAIELMPANGATACVAGTRSSMLDNTTGTDAGRLSTSSVWQSFSRTCGEINLLGPSTATNGNSLPTSADLDVVSGPLHTNDELLLCGHARFGRRPPGLDRGLRAGPQPDRGRDARDRRLAPEQLVRKARHRT